MILITHKLFGILNSRNNIKKKELPKDRDTNLLCTYIIVQYFVHDWKKKLLSWILHWPLQVLLKEVNKIRPNKDRLWFLNN